jgi:hypothetical protein
MPQKPEQKSKTRVFESMSRKKQGSIKGAISAHLHRRKCSSRRYVAITHILPWLTPLAATALLVVMIGAVIYHQQRGEGSMVRGNLVVILLLLIVALLRWFVLPL